MFAPVMVPQRNGDLFQDDRVLGVCKRIVVNYNHGHSHIDEHFRDYDDCNDGHVTGAVELRSLRKPQIVSRCLRGGGHLGR